MDILGPLLGEDGYNVKQLPRHHDIGFDLTANRLANSIYQSNSIGIQIKRYRRPLAVEQVRGLMGAGFLQGLDRVMLVTPSGFTSGAKNAVARKLPIQVELVDVEALKAWIARVEVDNRIDRLEIEQVLRVVSRRFAQLIAQDASNLGKLEWRNLEMTLAEVFDGLGFSVELRVLVKCCVRRVIKRRFSEPPVVVRL
jgi:restriction system protein